MTGLIEKDFRLIFTRWQTLLLFLGCSLLISYSMDGTFIIGYLSMLGMVLMIGTASYDELDNGMAFLFTLPVSRKTYVREKYLFCLIGSLIFWAIGICFYVVSTILKSGAIVFSSEDIVGFFIFIPIIVLGMCILLPIEIVLGSQKSRIGLMVLGAGLISFVFLSRSLFGEEALDNAIDSGIETLSKTPTALVVAAGVGIVLVIVFISYFISIKGLEKKEY